MPNLHPLNEDYISRQVFIFRVPQYTYTLKNIFTTTLLATYPFARQYYLKVLNPLDIRASKDLATTEGYCSDLTDTRIQEISEEIFSRGENFDFFEFCLFNTSISNDTVFSWSLGDFISLTLDDSQFAAVKAYFQAHGLPEDLYT